MSKRCRICGIDLEEGKNWYPADKRDHYHICITCHRLRARPRERLYKRRKRNTTGKLPIGTFDKKYLEVVNGRVFGAVLLERAIKALH